MTLQLRLDEIRLRQLVGARAAIREAPYAYVGALTLVPAQPAIGIGPGDHA